jgi:hypothetical protein
MSAWEEQRALAQCSKIDWAKRRAEGAVNPQRVILTERPVEPRPKDKIKPGYDTPGPMLGEEPGRKKKPKSSKLKLTPEERKERRRLRVARKKEKRRAHNEKRRKKPQVPYVPYDEYLHSHHWINFKRKYYEIYASECAFCKTAEGIDLHHRTYANRGSENFSDVVPLCREHHYECHNYDRQHPEFTLAESTTKWLNGAQPRSL